MRVLQVGPDGKFIGGKIAAKEEGNCEHCGHDTWQKKDEKGNMLQRGSCECLCHVATEQEFKKPLPAKR